MAKIIIGVIAFLSLALFIVIYFFYNQLFVPQKLLLISTTPKTEIALKNLTLEAIFNQDQNTFNLPKRKLTTIIATGDVIPARFINFQANKRNNFKWPYEKTYQYLKNADITFANLESPLIKNCPVTSSGMIFCGDEKNVQGLVYAGIDIVTLANNHAGNWDPKGVEDTVKLLNQNNILATGVNGAVYQEVKGTKFAFLGYDDIEKDPYLSSAEDEIISKEIKEAKTRADVIIVAFHWGTEYTDLPNQRQQALAHLAIDSGADLVLGNHPHWIQPVEIYQDKLIMYAHGNFIFDQFWSGKTLEGVVGKYYFYGTKLVDVEFLPIQIDNYGQPSLSNQETADKILTQLQLNSEKLRKVL